MAHDFTTGEGSTRAEVHRPRQSIARLPHAPRGPFRVRIHPRRLQCVKGEWLHLPKLAILDPGQGAVDSAGGEVTARVEAEKGGWYEVPWNAVPRGTPGGEYIAAHHCQGGLYHCLVWEEPQHMGDQAMPSELDEEGYHAWLRWLVSEGIVPAPDPKVVRRLVEKQRVRLAGLARESHKPEMRAVIDHEKATLAAMEEGLAKLERSGNAKPAAKRSRKRGPDAGDAGDGSAEGGDE